MFAILKINTTCKKCKNHFLVDTYVVHTVIGGKTFVSIRFFPFQNKYEQDYSFSILSPHFE